MFREINERLRELNQTFTTLTDQMDLICECADAGCAAHLSMAPTAYELLRAERRRFVVVPGHEVAPTIELVVERNQRYVIVEKTGDAAGAAEETEPGNGA